jgi:hypothetical protein
MQDLLGVFALSPNQFLSIVAFTTTGGVQDGAPVGG